MSGDHYSPTLRDALIRWCFPERVEDVQEFEIYFLSQELATFGWPNLGGASNRGQPVPLEHISRGEARSYLDAAWKGLLLDFRQRLERGQIHLWGIQSRPDRGMQSVYIPGKWAADFQFDPLANTMEMGDRRFINLSATEIAPSDQPSPSPQMTPATAGVSLRPEDCGAFSDEFILALLEEHGRRVVRTPDAKLVNPGKASFLPIIRRKLLARGEANELLSTKAAEFQFLTDWIASKIDHHQIPTFGTISKVLAKDYEAAEARSRGAIGAAIQKPKN